MIIIKYKSNIKYNYEPKMMKFKNQMINYSYYLMIYKIRINKINILKIIMTKYKNNIKHNYEPKMMKFNN